MSDDLPTLVWRLCQYVDCTGAYQDSKGQENHEKNFHVNDTNFNGRSQQKPTTSSIFRHSTQRGIDLTKEVRVCVERISSPNLISHALDLQKSGKSPYLRILKKDVQLREFKIEIDHVQLPPFLIDSTQPETPHVKPRSRRRSFATSAQNPKSELIQKDTDFEPKGYEEEGNFCYSSEPDSESESDSTPAPTPKPKTPTKGRGRQTKSKLKKCNHCPLKFESAAELQKHKRSHSIYPCTFPGCGKGFGFLSSLKIHLVIHESVRPYKCSHCPKAFADKSTLRNHEYTHSKALSYACAFCERKYTDPRAHRVHELSHTNGDKHKCRYCGKGYHKLDLWRIHERTHNGDRPFMCEECGKSFSTSQGLNAHKKVPHEGGVKWRNYSCKICGEGYTDNRHVCPADIKLFSLPNQIVEEEIPVEETITADAIESDPLAEVKQEFDDSLASRSRLKEPGAFVEVNIRDILPSISELEPEPLNTVKPVIDANFGESEPLTVKTVAPSMISTPRILEEDTEIDVKHQITSVNVKMEEEPMFLTVTDIHTTTGLAEETNSDTRQNSSGTNQQTPMPTTVFECVVCHQIFASSRKLRDHERSHEGKGLRPFLCDFPLCGEGLATAKKLRDHLASHYGGTLHNFCPQCGRGFRTAKTLAKHISSVHTHKGESRYKCSHCSKRFRDSDAMRNHELSQHLKTPMKCQFCEKEFLTRAQLVNHTRFHTGEKPYRCQFCNRAFRLSGSMNTHMRRVHLGEKIPRSKNQKRVQGPLTAPVPENETVETEQNVEIGMADA